MALLMTQAQCFSLAKGQPFTDANAETAAAIAMAETLTYQAGVQYADFAKVGDIQLMDAKWGASYGGWQVRSLKSEFGKATFRDADRLDEPNFNAWAAYKVWVEAGNSFKPWSTFTSGAYLGYLQKAKFVPVPAIPKGSYRVTGGDYLGRIALKTANGQKNYPWQLIAKINNIPSPGYTIFPGQVILLPDWPYVVAAGDTASSIASTYSEVTGARLAAYNGVVDANKLGVGQQLWIPRYSSWDGKTLVL